MEEVGAPYTLIPVAFPVRENQPEYLKLNPAGLFPTAVDDGEVLTESLSICDHVARKYGDGRLIVNPGESDYRRYLQHLLFGEATLGAPLANVMRYGPQQPPERQAPLVAQEALNAFGVRLDMLELGFGEGPYILSQRFSLADISVGYVLWLTKAFFGLGSMLGPKTTAYIDRIMTRPAFERAAA